MIKKSAAVIWRNRLAVIALLVIVGLMIEDHYRATRPYHWHRKTQGK